MLKLNKTQTKVLSDVNPRTGLVFVNYHRGCQIRGKKQNSFGLRERDAAFKLAELGLLKLRTDLTERGCLVFETVGT